MLGTRKGLSLNDQALNLLQLLIGVRRAMGKGTILLELLEWVADELSNIGEQIGATAESVPQ